ncbi:MAG: hypothetical protein LW636_02200 [Planctomycetaceae bacterium]|nr:hypothetical protein [Planctomycetaceae bacterium]
MVSAAVVLAHPKPSSVAVHSIAAEIGRQAARRGAASGVRAVVGRESAGKTRGKSTRSSSS